MRAGRERVAMLATCTVVLCGLLALEVVVLLIRDIIKASDLAAPSTSAGKMGRWV